MSIRKESVGLFVLGGLVLFGIGMFLIGDRHQLFARHTEYHTEFANLSGLTKGAKVRVSGLDAGEVLTIEVPDSPAARFRLRFRIDARLRALVRSDSVVTIGREGVVGGTYLSVRPGSSQSPQADALATIPSAEPTELSALLTSTAGLLDDVKDALKGVTSAVSNVNDVVVGLKEGRGTAGMLLSDDALASDIRRTVTAAGSSVRDIAADLQSGRGAAGMLLRDEAVAGQIREAVANTRAATADLGEATRKADALMTDLSSRQIPQKAGELVDRLRDSAQHIHQITSDISKPDQAGMSAGANIRSSLINVDTATANLADVTEAAKHNFLLRGFFNKRGYYSLAEISPERVSPGLRPSPIARTGESGCPARSCSRTGQTGRSCPRRERRSCTPVSHSAVTPLQDVPSSSKATQTAVFPPMSSASPATEPWRFGNTSRSGSRSIQRIWASYR